MFILIQLIASVLIILLVMLQSKGAGLSSLASGYFGMYRSRRGAEKGIFISTVVLSLVLVANSLYMLITS